MNIKTLKSIVALTVITAFSGASLMAGDMKQDAMNDCAMMKDGGMMVVKDGHTMPMEHAMTMSDGTKVTKKGKVVMKDGKTMTLKNGDMVMMDGKMMMMKDGKMMEKQP